jgi:hypothetical protein
MYKQELPSGSEIATTDSVYISDDVFFSNGFNIFRSTFFSYLGRDFLWFVPKVFKILQTEREREREREALEFYARLLTLLLSCSLLTELHVY